MIKYKESLLNRKIHKRDYHFIGKEFFNFLKKSQKIEKRFEQVEDKMSRSISKIVAVYLLKEFPDYYLLMTKSPELVRTHGYYQINPLSIFSSKLNSQYLKINNFKVSSKYSISTDHAMNPLDVFKNSDINDCLKVWIVKNRFSIPEIDRELNNIFAIYYERSKIYGDFIKHLSDYFIIPKNFYVRSESFYNYSFNSIFPSFVEKNNIVTCKDLLDFDEDLFLEFCENIGINYLEANEDVNKIELFKEAEKIRNLLS